MTPLYHAVASGHVDCMQLLVEKGADTKKIEKVRMHPLAPQT